MITTTSILAAQGTDWIQIAIFLGVVVLSMVGSAAKWITQQLAASRERAAQQRGGSPLEPIERNEREDEEVRRGTPPLAAPPPVFHRPRRPEPSAPPVMEKMFEILMERAAGTPLERRVRELMPPRSAPPPPKRKIEPATRKPVRPPVSATRRPQTIAEREALRERVTQTEAERETERLAQREQRFTDQTDQRIGHVETHIAALDHHEDPLDEFRESIALEDAAAVRRALVLSEILAPPLALRAGC